MSLINTNTGFKQRKDSTNDSGINKDLAYNYYFGMNSSEHGEVSNNNTQKLMDNEMQQENKQAALPKNIRNESLQSNNNSESYNSISNAMNYIPNNESASDSAHKNCNINYNINYNNNFNLPQPYYNKTNYQNYVNPNNNLQGINNRDFNINNNYNQMQNNNKNHYNITARYFVIKSVDEDNIHKVYIKYKD